jgi:hypothetical protein
VCAALLREDGADVTKTEQLWMTILGQALNAALSEGKLPSERDTVAKAAPHVISELIDLYTGKQRDGSRFAQALYDLTQACLTPGDEVVSHLDSNQRQQLWAVIGMMNQERRKHVQETEPAKAEVPFSEP